MVQALTGSVALTDKANITLFFDIIREDNVSLQSQITDNYIENNTSVQDHIALSPLVINLSGLIGDIVYTAPTTFYDAIINSINNFTGNTLNVTTDKLSPISALLPPLSNANQTARNAVQYVESSYRRYENIIKSGINLYSNSGSKETRLQQVYAELALLRESRALVTVKSPYSEYPYENMAIQSITMRQGEQNYISDIEVTLKQVKFAQTQTTKPDTSVMATYNAIPRVEQANCGKAQGVSKSLAATMVDGNNVPFSTWTPR